MASYTQESTSPGEDSEVPITRLYREVVDGHDDVTDRAGPAKDSRAMDLLNAVNETVFEDNPVDFNRSVVRNELDTILLVLIALGDTETHGRGLIQTIDDLMGMEFSPGSVYPELHTFEEEGTVRKQELVRSKEYQVADDTAVRDRIEEARNQHLVLGAFFARVLDEL